MKVLGIDVHGTYGTAQGIAGLFALFGWVIVTIGALIALGGLAASAPFNVLIVGLGVGLAALGLLQVAAGQMLRAMVDTADYARQSLLLQLAVVEGRTEIDLQRPFIAQGQRPSFIAPTDPARAPQSAAPAQPASDISKGLSKEAIAVLQRAADKGYDVRFSPDKSSVILKSGSWEASFSSEEKIIKFGQNLR